MPGGVGGARVPLAVRRGAERRGGAHLSHGRELFVRVKCTERAELSDGSGDRVERRRVGQASNRVSRTPGKAKALGPHDELLECDAADFGLGVRGQLGV